MSQSTSHDRPPPCELRVCRAIRELAAGTTADTVAQDIHVRPATVAAWQADADFQVLVRCVRESGTMRDAVDMLNALTPEAVETLREALDSEDKWLAVQAAREVLKYVAHIQQVTEQVIRVEYVNPDRHPVSTTPWADRHPAAPGALQGGGVRSPLRENGNGQDSDD